MTDFLSIVFDDLLLPQHLCDREPSKRPTMRVHNERSKCEAVSTGMSITAVIPVCHDQDIHFRRPDVFMIR